MFCFFMVKAQYIHSTISISLSILVILFFCYFNTEYLFDIYSLHTLVKEYEHFSEKISEEDIIKWIHTYRHPLIVKNISRELVSVSMNNKRV